ncbi:MAG: tyrosine-type recombinase/integrase, partial [Erysipelotrichaceae bacterium]
MSVHKRGKTWGFRTEVFDEAKNKKVHKRIGHYATKNEAKKAEAKYLANIELFPSTTLTVNDVFNLYVADRTKKVKDTTIYDIKKKYRLHILPNYGSLKLHKLSKIEIMKFQDYLLEKKYKNSQIKNLQTLFNSIIKFAIKHEMMERNPFDILGYVSTNEAQVEMLFFTYEEYLEFEKELLSDGEMNLYDAALIVLYWTGLRCGELQALTWKDFRGDCLYVHSTYDNKLKKISDTTKTRKNRYVYLSDTIIDLLSKLKMMFKKYTDFDNEKFIFGYYDVISHKSLSNTKNFTIDAYNKTHAIELPKIRIHDLRHSHASLLINRGCTSFEVAKRLGNTPTQIEKTYAHMFKSTQLKMVENLNELSSTYEKLPKFDEKLPNPQKKPLNKGLNVHGRGGEDRTPVCGFGDHHT